MLIAAYHMLQNEVNYQDLAAEHFDRQRRARVTAQLVNRLQHLGYTVTLAAVEEPAA
jgi:hypothetical protein